MSTMSDTVEDLSAKAASQQMGKTMAVKTRLKGYRQKLMTIKVRIRYHEQTIKGFRKHLKNGTFPQRMKSIKPYPKMQSLRLKLLLMLPVIKFCPSFWIK